MEVPTTKNLAFRRIGRIIGADFWGRLFAREERVFSNNRNFDMYPPNLMFDIIWFYIIDNPKFNLILWTRCIERRKIGDLLLCKFRVCRAFRIFQQKPRARKELIAHKVESDRTVLGLCVDRERALQLFTLGNIIDREKSWNKETCYHFYLPLCIIFFWWNRSATRSQRSSWFEQTIPVGIHFLVSV